MKIKNYKCKCGHNDFFFADKGNQKGIYCSYCGKWLKWADKDEQNLAMKQEPRKGCWCPQDDNYFYWYECSECGYGSEGEMEYSSEVDVRTNYCPNCGAKMEVENNADNN